MRHEIQERDAQMKRVTFAVLSGVQSLGAFSIPLVVSSREYLIIIYHFSLLISFFYLCDVETEYKTSDVSNIDLVTQVIWCDRPEACRQIETGALFERQAMLEFWSDPSALMMINLSAGYV